MSNIGFFWPSDGESCPSEDFIKEELIKKISEKSEVRVGSLSYKNHSIDDLLKILKSIESPPGTTIRTRRKF